MQTRLFPPFCSTQGAFGQHSSESTLVEKEQAMGPLGAFWPITGPIITLDIGIQTSVTAAPLTLLIHPQK